MLAKIILLFCSVNICAAHLCMMSPPQRTPLNNINKAGSNSCLLLKGPCGLVTPSATKLTLDEGSKFPVVFQKNLDHFNPAAPGNWTVSIFNEKGSYFKELYFAADTSAPSLTLYVANVIIPDVAAGNDPVPMVIQSVYNTNNASAPAAFYQCSDVLIQRKK